MSLADELAAAGGVQAPPQATARLKELLGDNLRRGAEELGRKRSGTREDPVTVVFAADGERLLAAVPATPALRADIDALPDRAWLLVAAVVGALVELAAPPALTRVEGLELRVGEVTGHAVLGYPAPALAPAELEDLAPLAFEDLAEGIDRLRADGLALPEVVLGDVALREPIGSPPPPRGGAGGGAGRGGRPEGSGWGGDHGGAVPPLLGARGGPARAP